MDEYEKATGGGLLPVFDIAVAAHLYAFMGQSSNPNPRPFQAELAAETNTSAADAETLRALADDFNAARRGLARRVRRITIAIAVPAALVIGIAGLFAVTEVERRFGPGGLFPTVAGGFALWLLLILSLKVLTGEPIRLLEIAFRRDLAPSLFPFVARFQFYDGGRPSEMERLSRTRLFTFLDSTHSRTLTGAFEGLPFVMTRAALVRGRVKVAGINRQMNAFEGVVVRLPPPVAFSGTLLLRSHAPDGFQLPPDPVRGKGQLVKSGDAELDKRVTLYSDRPDVHVSALAKLRQATVAMMDSGAYPRVHLAITGEDCFVLLACSRGLFELPGLGRPVHVERDLLPIAADLRNILSDARVLRGAVAQSPPPN
ncbi:hypothetical protein ASG42_05740 [Rhizobium sp. Leaf391]|nr:hypothetical protein ASG50_23150 [Rhizobium sp. Leaf386]KQT00343.1 hypothetical protein ASG42_05740 [Rhizobium sp. Leaf391]